MEKWQSLLNNINHLRNENEYVYVMKNWAELQKCLSNLPDENWKQIYCYTDANWSKLNVYAKIYIASAILEHTNNPIWLKRILDAALESDMTTEELFFLKSQLNSWIFVNNELATASIARKMYLLHERVRNEFRGKVRLPQHKIPIKKRNKNFILVLTAQMLSPLHAPTRSTLGRCKSIIEELGKEVLLINTGEMLGMTGKIPMFRMVEGNYIKEFQEREVWEYKGCKIPYNQLSNEMPYMDWLQNFLDLIAEFKPYQIVLMGGGGIVGELCDSLVDTLMISYCPSSLVDTWAGFQQIGRALLPEDDETINLLHLKRESIISGVFTSDLKEQNNHFSRKELGIPEGRFVVAVVGARLNEEVTDEFLDTLAELEKSGGFAVFMGVFDEGYNSLQTKYPELYKNSRYFGMVDDVLAYMECCDLYLNPRRRGGGMSAVEALIKGVPVITVAFGDVYTNVSDDFAVKDYTEMQDVAIRYMTDQEFYREKSLKAKQRAEMLLDTEHMFADIMRDFERRMLEKEGKILNAESH